MKVRMQTILTNFPRENSHCMAMKIPIRWMNKEIWTKRFWWATMVLMVNEYEYNIIMNLAWEHTALSRMVGRILTVS